MDIRYHFILELHLFNIVIVSGHMQYNVLEIISFQAQGHNATRSRVKHSTTEPLCPPISGV